MFWDIQLLDPGAAAQIVGARFTEHGG